MSKCPITLLYEFQNRKKFYIYLSLFLAFLLLISHFLLQEYLFMRPCEQCVYIRFAFCIIFFACMIAILNPKNNFLKSLFYIFVFFGIYYGFVSSLKLLDIYNALNSGDIFSVSCKMVPEFAFKIPLDKYFSFFQISGECGNDIAYIPKENINDLSFFQNIFIGNNGLYKNGWYLFPWFKFINMVEFCLFVFFVIFVFVFLNFFAFIFKAKKKYFIFVILFSTIFILLDAFLF